MSERPRRYLFLTQTFPRYPEDTAGPFIRDLARGLVRLGDGVTVLVPHAEGVRNQWVEHGVEVRSFRYAPAGLEMVGYGRTLQADERVKWKAALATPLYLWGARRAVEQELSHRRYDLVHAHWIVPNGVLTSSLFGGSGVSGPRLAIGLHGSDVFLAERPLVRRWVRSALARSQLLTGCSPELVNRVLALQRQRPEQHQRPDKSGSAQQGSRQTDRPGLVSEVIPYGVDCETFVPDAEGRNRGRQRLGLREGDIVALGVGRMATKKGFQVLIPKLGRLLDICPDMRLVLAGGGDREAEFRASVSQFGDRAIFPGSVGRDWLPDLYRAADLFVLPAVHDTQGNVDGLPNVILEAMASGLPVVASAISGIPLAIRDGIEGLLVPEKDGDALVGALTRLLGDADLRARMGVAGRERAAAELTWDRVAARYRAAYDSVLVGGEPR